MKRRFLLIMALLVAITTISRTGFADVPRFIDYQGRLMDAAGKPVANGIYVVIVNLYNSGQTTLLWTKTYTAVSAANGYFSITLGDATPQWTSLDFNQQYYIGTQIGGDTQELSPRQSWNAAPYAMNVADGAITNNKFVAGAVGTTTVADNSITIGKIDPTLWQAILPIGTILGWHGNMQNTPGLPADFVRCNGQILIDLSSPYNGEVIPNLNGISLGAPLPCAAAAGGTTLTPAFLRGGATSGNVQLDALKDHTHDYIADGASGWGAQAGSIYQVMTYTGTTQGVNSPNGGSAETRPVNMSVIWIMKIK